MSDLEIRTLETESPEAFLAVVEAAFGFREEFETYLATDPLLTDRDTLLGVFEGQPVAAVQIFTKEIRLRGEAVGLGGIGSVSTLPMFERRGFSTQLLRRAIAEMEARGMALSLLFTGRLTFYERLDWHAMPYSVWVAHRNAPSSGAGRAFVSSDLPAVRRLYDLFSSGLEATTVRNEAYWDAQLKYAGVGSTNERFDVFETAGDVVAYTRCSRMYGLQRVMEYGCVPGEEAALATLLVEQALDDMPSFMQVCEHPGLADALSATAAQLDVVEFPDAMWRVIDRPRVARLAGMPGDSADKDLLTRLVGGADSLFWTSDRF